MFPRQDGQDGAPEWTRLGTFAGSQLTFVRELLQGEGIAHREEFLAGYGGAAAMELCVLSLEHARVEALLAAAQAQAEAAAHRESAVLAAEHERAAVAARASAVAERGAARRAAKAEARRLARQRLWALRHRSNVVERKSADHGVRILGGLLAAIILLFVGIGFIGERYGTHAPAPGHHGKTVACTGRYQVVCF
jgi:hypothetical protein